MLIYENLKDIFKIPERPLTEEMLDFSDLLHDQKIEKRKKNVQHSIQDRWDFLLNIQYENKLQRIKLLEHAHTDPEIQKWIIKRCSEDPIYFFNMLLWTYNPRLLNPHLPFILYPYQEISIIDVIDSIER